jgi:hypothetical protein
VARVHVDPSEYHHRLEMRLVTDPGVTRSLLQEARASEYAATD